MHTDTTAPATTLAAAAEPEQELEDFMIHENKLFSWKEIMGFAGFVPCPKKFIIHEDKPYLREMIDGKNRFVECNAPFAKTEKPWLEWRGAKLPLSLWQTVLAFFQSHKANEVQVRLYHNPITMAWQAHAFPQEYPCGMTTREIPGHTNMVEDCALFPEPWVRMGSVHHHCGATAFQSGTDRTDEESVVGLHITVGKLYEPKFDLHSRVCIRLPGQLDAAGNCICGPTQSFYDADLTEWFMLPQSWSDVLPEPIQNLALLYMLHQPAPKEISYPKRWEDNLIRREAAHPNGPSAHASGRSRTSYPNPHHYAGGTNSAGSNGGANGDLPHLRKPPTLADGSWNLINHEIIELITTLVETLHDDDGKFVAQIVDTSDWRTAGFANLEALEKLLRSVEFHKAAPSIWCFPRDREKVDAVLIQMAETEAREEIEGMNPTGGSSSLPAQGNEWSGEQHRHAFD